MGSRQTLALFNMLGPLAGLRVLDAYAGTGALGREALRRGAAAVDFVEKNPALAEKLDVRPCSVRRFTELAVANRDFAPYNLVIADPPYDHIDLAELELLTKLVGPGGTFVLSSPAAADAPAFPGFTLEKTRTYAAARISIYHQT